MKNDSIPLGRALVSDVQGAVGLWISAVTHITEAQTALHTMVRSGLASRVMTNGLLSTFYQLRLEKLLTENEIIQIQEVVSLLESLDATNEQFDLRLRAVVARVGDEVDRRIVQVEAMSIMFALA